MTTLFGCFAILVLATAIPEAAPSGRLWDQFRRARTSLVAGVEWFGELEMFCSRLFRAAVVPPYEFQELIRQCDAIGSKSLSLAALAGAATGVVISLQTHDSLVRFGTRSMLPAVVVFSILKESGPVITGLVMSGRHSFRKLDLYQ